MYFILLLVAFFFHTSFGNACGDADIATMVGSALTYTDESETYQVHEIQNLRAAVKSSTNDMVISGSHMNTKYWDQYVFMYYLDYSSDCEVKWLKRSYDFDEI